MGMIVLASGNPVKARATLGGFRRVFPDQKFDIECMPVPSGVADQPRSDAETLEGAENRAARVQRRHPAADYWVGIEGGIVDDGEEMTAFAWVVVRSRSRHGKSRTSTFQLPAEVCC